MKQPLIGVLPLFDTEKESYWMLPGYFEGIQHAGGIPVMLPLTADGAARRQLAETLDGFLFTGGHDVSPALYGAEPTEACGLCCAERDAMEAALFPLLWAQDKPILGICRGIQVINALLGGTLYQDLPTEHPSGTEHHQHAPYDRPVHRVSLVADSPLQQLLGKDTLPVNSYHHQAIRELAAPLRAMAIADDGLTEAVYASEKTFLWAVQWHPEFSFYNDESSRRIFRRFVESCRTQN